jgi:hypothetical protein
MSHEVEGVVAPVVEYLEQVVFGVMRAEQEVC